MSETVGEAMDDVEISRFLRKSGLGVLGLAADGESYTIPIAFADDEESRRCIFRFLATDDGEKMAFVSTTEIASLTAYEWGGPADWRSVVLRGPLSRLAEDDVAQAATVFADLGAEAALAVFRKPVSAYETGWYELQIEDCTGRGGFE